MNKASAAILGIALFLGLVGAGYIVSSGILELKKMERTVSVKGLSEREVEANVALWPIEYVRAGNDLSALYSALERDRAEIEQFLLHAGFKREEMSLGSSEIIDKLSQDYVNSPLQGFRYIGSQTLTLRSESVKLVRESLAKVGELSKRGIILRSNYGNQVQYLYTKLNEIKPVMIEEATHNARQSAQKFAEDSKSQLGKIRHAAQGQFSINNRDESTPYIKSVRVVSSIEYYLSD